MIGAWIGAPYARRREAGRGANELACGLAPSGAPIWLAAAAVHELVAEATGPPRASTTLKTTAPRTPVRALKGGPNLRKAFIYRVYSRAGL